MDCFEEEEKKSFVAFEGYCTEEKGASAGRVATFRERNTTAFDYNSFLFLGQHAIWVSRLQC